MAVKTLYITTGAASNSAFHVLQDGGSAPNFAVMTSGWIAGTTAPTAYSLMSAGVERLASTFGGTALPNAAPNNTLGDGFRTANKINGTFANANWSLSLQVQGITRPTSTTDGRLRVDIWRSANEDMSSATKLTASPLVTSQFTNITNDTPQALTATWSPGGTVEIPNEYLFIQVAGQIDVAGSHAAADFHLCAGSSNTLTTSDFTEAATTITCTSAISTSTSYGSPGIHHILPVVGNVSSSTSYGSHLFIGWLSGWSARFKITGDMANKITASLTAFVLIYDFTHTNTPSTFWTKVRSDGGDIRVTLSDGMTEVPRKVAVFDTDPHRGLVWFKDDVTTTNESYYIYYGKSDATEPAADSTYGRYNVWTTDDRFATIDGGATDETSNQISTNLTGTTVGTYSLGDTRDYDGIDDRSVLGNISAIENVSRVWLSAWVKYDTLGDWEIIFTSYDSATNALGFGLSASSRGGTNDFEFFVRNGSDGVRYTTGDYANTTSWTRVDMVFDGTLAAASRLKGFTNGVERTLTQYGIDPPTTTPTVTALPAIAAIADGSVPMDGNVGFVRVSTLAVTSQRIQSEYNIQSNVNAFWTVSAEESISTTTTLTLTSAISSSTSYGMNILGYILPAVGNVSTSTSYGTNVLNFILPDAGNVSTSTSYGTNVLGYILPAVGNVSTSTSYGTNRIDLVLPAVGNLSTSTSYGSHSVALTVLVEPTAIATSDTIGTATLTFILPGVGNIQETTSYGTNTLTFSILDAGNVSTSTQYGDHSIALTVFVEPTVLGTSQTFGTARIDLILPAVGNITETTSYGTALLQFYLNPSQVSTTETFGTASVTPIEVVEPGAISTSQTFDTAALHLTILDAGNISTSETIGVVLVTVGEIITPLSIGTSESIGTLRIDLILPAVGNIGTSSSYGTMSISSIIILEPTVLNTTDSTGQPAIHLSLVNVGNIATSESIGTNRIDLALPNVGNVISTDVINNPQVTSVLAILAQALTEGTVLQNPAVLADVGIQANVLNTSTTFGAVILLVGEYAFVLVAGVPTANMTSTSVPQADLSDMGEVTITWQ